MYRCALCTTVSFTYPSIEELEVHIAADHVNYVPYECEKCRFSRYPTEFALISHYTNDHCMKEFYVRISCSYFLTFRSLIRFEEDD